MTTSRKVTGDLKYYQAKLCFQGMWLHGLSFLIFTPKFVFEMYLTCCKLIVFDVQNKNVVPTYPVYCTTAESNKTTAGHLGIKTVQTYNLQSTTLS